MLQGIVETKAQPVESVRGDSNIGKKFNKNMMGIDSQIVSCEKKKICLKHSNKVTKQRNKQATTSFTE